MKKLLLFAAIAAIFTSCSKDETTESFVLRSDAKLRIESDVNQSATLRSAYVDTTHLTPLEIVKRATSMRFFNDKLSNNDCAAGFAGKDTISETPAFLRYGTDIINNDGFGKPYLVPDFVYAYDCVIEIYRSSNDIDTVAYIPNSAFKKLEFDVSLALSQKDTASVYEALKNDLKFIPITGREYQDLKKQNLQ